MYTTRIAQIYDFRAKTCLISFVLFPLVDMGYTEGFFKNVTKYKMLP